MAEQRACKRLVARVSGVVAHSDVMQLVGRPAPLLVLPGRVSGHDAIISRIDNQPDVFAQTKPEHWRPRLIKITVERTTSGAYRKCGGGTAR